MATETAYARRVRKQAAQRNSKDALISELLLALEQIEQQLAYGQEAMATRIALAAIAKAKGKAE